MCHSLMWNSHDVNHLINSNILITLSFVILSSLETCKLTLLRNVHILVLVLPLLLGMPSGLSVVFI